MSSPVKEVDEVTQSVLDELALELDDAIDALDYYTTAQVQSYKIKPKPENTTYPTLHVKIGYADTRNRSAVERLNRHESPQTVTLDFSFNEPFYDEISVTFSSEIDPEITLNCYSLNEVVAEKFRAILQQPVRNRLRQQDLYDIFKILQNHSSLVDAAKVHSLLVEKAKGRDIDKYMTKGGLVDPDVRAMFEKGLPGLAETTTDTPDLDSMLEVVNPFYQSMPWDES